MVTKCVGTVHGICTIPCFCDRLDLAVVVTLLRRTGRTEIKCTGTSEMEYSRIVKTEQPRDKFHIKVVEHCLHVLRCFSVFR